MNDWVVEIVGWIIKIFIAVVLMGALWNRFKPRVE
tara:strand:+ start:5196 stop:5300 length:105 start_codon:yes stop_codon:yes gene_type:complete